MVSDETLIRYRVVIHFTIHADTCRYVYRVASASSDAVSCACAAAAEEAGAVPAAEAPAEEALQDAEVPEEGAAGGGGRADLVSMQVRAADTVTYDHDTVMIWLRYK